MLGQITYWNAFGFDRETVQGYFSWPIRFREALLAKNITLGLLLLPQLTVITGIVLAFRMPVTLPRIFECLAVTFIAALYWCAAGNIASVRIPRPMDAEKMNQMSNKLQALGIWTAPFLLLPIVLAYVARSVLHSEFVFAAILLLAAIIGVIFYSVGLDSAVTYANSHRENIIAQLSRSDGPLSTS
jgi:ABC-2 type transport system permease protein